MSHSIKHHLLSNLNKYKHNDALSIGKDTWTYQQLFGSVVDNESKLLDFFEEQQCIGVLADKSFSGYQCIASVFLTGHTYVPLNEDYPLSRNAHIIEKTGIKTIIVSANCQPKAQQLYEHLGKSINIIVLDESDPNHMDMAFTPAKVAHHKSVPEIAEDTAYVLFTSGTTGQPKGVAISNQQIDSYITNITHEFDFHADDRFSQFFAFTFDLSLHDMLVCWVSGACLCPSNKMALLMPLQFAKKQRITVWFSVPSLVQSAKDVLKKRFNAFRLPDIRCSFFCGEALPTTIADDWLAVTENKPVINLYGPTEATIAFTAQQHSKSDKNKQAVVSIGRPFGNNTCAIFDETGSKPHPGETGELCLSGPQVFTGYLNQQKPHNEVFHTTKENGELINWYRTGDVVSKQKNGNIKYHGRNDRQVQLKGFRVELQEVEHQLRCILPDTTIAVIVNCDNEDQQATTLTAFIKGPKSCEKKLHSMCHQTLPHYMVPEHFVFLPDFPYNASGKLDHNQLKQIAKEHITSPSDNTLAKKA